MAWPSLIISRPSVIALNTWISRPNGTVGLIDKIKLSWLKRASKVIAVSDAIRKRCFVNAIVIGNPYKNHEFKILADSPRIRDFVFLGRLVSDKGADQTIMALHKITRLNLKENPLNILPTLTIVGDGPERAKLEHLVEKYSLKDQVRFTGSLVGEVLTSCLNQHRFILIPSTWEEPFGNVALEGMACGCVPIASDSGGLSDAVGEAGLTFTRGDSDALVDCIQAILKNPEIEKRLQDAAPGHLRKHHPYVVSKKYLDIFENVLRS
ncbi:MAG: glycosyltransferase family 4 protein [Chitinophagaceae bacterium]